MKLQKLGVRDSTPAVRSGHRLVSVGCSSFVLFGGYMSHRVNGSEVPDLKQEIWRLHCPTLKWSKLVTTGAFPQSTASCAVIVYNNTIIVFGGSGSTFGATNSSSLHSLDLNTLEWSTIQVTGDQLEEGYGHSISINKSHLYIYGGCNGHHFYNTMHAISLADWKNKSYFRGHGGGKYRHESVCYKDNVYIIGGGTSTNVDDMSVLPYFNTTSNKWCQRELSKPAPIGRIAHSCNIINNHVYITGGHFTSSIEGILSQKVALADIWMLDLDQFVWTKLEVELPFGLFFHSACASSQNELFIFGGSTYVLDSNDEAVNSRLNTMFRLSIGVASLVELSWSVVSGLSSKEVLVDAGVPPFLLERLEIKA